MYIYSNDIILKIFTLISYNYDLTQIYPSGDSPLKKKENIIELISNCIITKKDIIQKNWLWKLV